MKLSKRICTTVKSATSILLSAAVFALPFQLGVFPAVAEESGSRLVCFEDDFNREDGSIHGSNGWYSQILKDPVCEHQIENGVLMAKDYFGGNGAVTSHSTRPVSEAAVNQRVSADILNLNDYAIANIHTRFVFSESYVTAPDTSYYAEVTNQYIRIMRVNATWSGEKSEIDNGGEKTYYDYNPKHIYRIELVAVGIFPTKLTATLYDVTAGYIPVATVTGTDSKAELQVMGTVGLSGSLNGETDTARFDNFKYEHPQNDTTDKANVPVFSDEFDRADGEIGNGWLTGSMTSASVSDGALRLQTAHPLYTYNAQISETAVVRPMSEAKLDQVISADFQSVGQQNGKEPGIWAEQGGAIIGRCQGETVTDNNCYRVYAQLGYGGDGCWETPIEEALIEMYLAGVSVRRVEDITEALWGSKVSPATISELNKKAYVHIEEWRNRRLQGGKYPYVYVDGIWLKRNWGGEYQNVSILVAIAVNEDGYREILGAAEGMKEDKASWVNFFQWLRGRGLEGVQLIVGDKCLGMLEAVGEVFPEAMYCALSLVIRYDHT